MSPGRLVGGRYRLGVPIARGGMAEVWSGHDEVLARPVAVKVLHGHLASDEAVRRRFRREAVTAARLAHPNVVATFDTGLDGDLAYIVMELVPGETLRDLLAARGPLPPALAVSIADQIADALGAAHRAALVHRDIKPANVLVAEDDGSVVRVKVTDFGIAKAAEEVGGDLTVTGTVIGTPKYLSPEQVEGREPDARADLYALGVVLFEMVTGRPPFEGPTQMATALSHLRDEAPRVSSRCTGVPQALDDVVAGLLAKDPAARPGSAAEVRRALAALPAADSFVPGAGSSGDGSPGAGSSAAGTPPLGFPEGRRPVRPGAAAAGGPLDLTAATQLAGRPAAQAAAATKPPNGSGAPADRAGGWPPSTPTSVSPAAGRSSPTGPTSRAASRPGSSGDAGGGAAAVADAGTAVGSAAALRTPPGRRIRRWAPGIVVLALVAAGGVVAAVLLVRADGGPATTRTPAVAAPHAPPFRPLTAVAARVVVAPGHSADDAAGASNVLADSGSGYWQTDLYGNAHFGNLYPGIGLAVQLSGTQVLRDLTVTSTSTGWTAQAYVGRTPPPASGLSEPSTLYGAPTGSATATSTTTVLPLGDRRARWVLLWLTSTGGPPYQVTITHVSVD